MDTTKKGQPEKTREFVFDSISSKHIPRKHKLVESLRFEVCMRICLALISLLISIPNDNNHFVYTIFPHIHQTANLITMLLRILALFNRLAIRSDVEFDRNGNRISTEIKWKTLSATEVSISLRMCYYLYDFIDSSHKTWKRINWTVRICLKRLNERMFSHSLPTNFTFLIHGTLWKKSQPHEANLNVNVSIILLPCTFLYQPLTIIIMKRRKKREKKMENVKINLLSTGSRKCWSRFALCARVPQVSNYLFRILQW